jgi:hypothetical protein
VPGAIVRWGAMGTHGTSCGGDPDDQPVVVARRVTGCRVLPSLDRCTARYTGGAPPSSGATGPVSGTILPPPDSRLRCLSYRTRKPPRFHHWFFQKHARWRLVAFRRGTSAHDLARRVPRPPCYHACFASPPPDCPTIVGAERRRRVSAPASAQSLVCRASLAIAVVVCTRPGLPECARIARC